jgi:hypothetical protein
MKQNETYAKYQYSKAASSYEDACCDRKRSYYAMIMVLLSGPSSSVCRPALKVRELFSII